MTKLLASPFVAAALLASGPASGGGGASAAEGEPLAFTHALDDSPLDVLTPRPGESFTPAVAAFHRTGENPYSGDAAAVAEGQAIYRRWCQSCHMPDGSGRMGPSLIDDRWRRARAATDKGLFEVVYGGAAGAMQAFGGRIDQDDILRLMAYLETLRGT